MTKKEKKELMATVTALFTVEELTMIEVTDYYLKVSVYRLYSMRNALDLLMGILKKVNESDLFVKNNISTDVETGYYDCVDDVYLSFTYKD